MLDHTKCITAFLIEFDDRIPDFREQSAIYARANFIQ